MRFLLKDVRVKILKEFNNFKGQIHFSNSKYFIYYFKSLKIIFLILMLKIILFFFSVLFFFSLLTKFYSELFEDHKLFLLD